MRDILKDLFGTEPLDPMESARRNMRPSLRKRFYQAASVGEGAPFPLLLDGRAVKTPAARVLAAPVQALGQAIAAEWDAQGERIDPATMPLHAPCQCDYRRVAPQRSVIDEIAKYLGSDLVCYRAGSGSLVPRAGGALGSDRRLGARTLVRVRAERGRGVRRAA